MAKNGCRTEEVAEKTKRESGYKWEELPPFRVRVDDGKKEVIVTGNDGQFVLYQQGGDGLYRGMGLYYSSLEGLCTALLRRKVSNLAAETLGDIIVNMGKVRKELIGMFTIEGDDLK